MQTHSMIGCKMEVCSLHRTLSPCLTSTSLVRRGRHYGQFPKFCSPSKYPCFIKSHVRAQQRPGAASLSSATVEASSQNVNSKDEDTVFVAGATGRVGSRTVRELLKLGFRVKAGVRSAQRAESLVQSVRQMKIDTEATDGAQPIEKLEIVECDLEKHDQILPALGRASLVICCIGASEKEIFDVTGPYRIDYLATKNLIDAATVAKVDHFMLLTSLGTNKVGFPAAILNLFWGVLLWKRKAEEALIDSGLPYSIVRPGGMERPTDSFKETHNLILFPEDTKFGGLVSNLQVAELMAFMAQNRELSYCKIVEVIAETTAPLTPMGDLLVKIPSKRAYVYKTKTPEAVSKVEPLPLQISVTDGVKDKEPSEEKTVELAEETKGDKSGVPRPLSPYAMYEDLKPPTSPSPSLSTTPKEPSEVLSTVDGVPNVVDGALMQTQPLSPYAAYDDLKPPTSPTPTAPIPLSTPTVDVIASAVDGSPMATTFNVDTIEPAKADESLVATTTSNEDTVEPVKADEAGDSEDSTAPKPRPLSPYAMYDDMKPPTSPTPSLGNH